MKWQFIANTPAELAKVGTALFSAAKQNPLDEQVQMTRLLESLSATKMLKYPVRVRHTGDDAVPDFQLEAGEIRIAVEITKITVPDVEHARALQNKGLKATLSLSSLYRKTAKPRRKEEVIAEGFGIPTFVFPVSLVELGKIWTETVQAAITDKSKVLSRADFQRGDENWLLLWDRLGTDDWQLKERMDALTPVLLPLWNAAWYSRVFLQNHHFFWQAMATPKEWITLPNHRAAI